MSVDFQGHVVLDSSGDDGFDVEVDGRSVADPTARGVGQDPDRGMAEGLQRPGGLLESIEIEMRMHTGNCEVEPAQ